MNPLSKEARDALKALDGSEPTAADERRVRQQLERSLGVIIPVATVAAATTATTAAASTGAASSATAGLTSLGLGAKVVLFVAAVSVGSLVTVGAKAVITSASTPASAPVKQSVTVVAPTRPVAAVTPVVVEPVAVEPVAVVAPAQPEPEVVAPAPVVAVAPVIAASAPRPSPSRPVARLSESDAPETAPVVEVAATPEIAPPAPKAPPSTEEEFDVEVEVNFPSCDAATELRSALAARRLLMEKHAEHALWLLSAYQKRCASGRWSDEAWRVRLASLCTLGRNREATSLLEWFTSEYPARRPAIEAMLRGSCAPEVLGE